MKNLSNFNLLIIILLFSSCQQQPFTGTVHIIPYPNQIAIGTQYRPIGKNLSIYLSPESGMDKDYIEDLLSDTGVKCKFTNFKWIADLTFDIEPDTIGCCSLTFITSGSYPTTMEQKLRPPIQKVYSMDYRHSDN